MPFTNLTPLGFILLAALLTQYNGGLETWALMWIIIAGGLTALFAWLTPQQVIQENKGSASLHRLGAITASLYAAGLTWAVFHSFLPGYSLEIALGMGQLVVGFWIMRCAQRRGVDPWALWQALLLVAIVVAAICALERRLTGQRAYASFSDPNMLAGWFNVFILMIFAGLIGAIHTSNSKAIWISATTLLLFSIAQGSTGSLSGIVCLTITLPLLLISTWRGKKSSQKTIAAVAAALIVAIAFAASRSGNDQPGEKLKALSQHSSFTVRVEMAQATLQMYQDHSWLGSGLGSFRLLYPRYRGPLDTGSAGSLAHNDYAQFLLEGGPLLLCALLLMWMTAFASVWDVHKKTAVGMPSKEDTIRTGAVFGLIALLLQAGMNFIFYSASLALTAGVLLALSAPAPAKAASGRRSSSFAHAVVVSAILLIGVTTIGARGLFIGLVTDRCTWQGCSLLRADAVFLKRLSDFLSATQPTWLFSRDYLSSRYLIEEAKTEKEEEKSRWRRLALKENVGMLKDFSGLSGSYVIIADLLKREPALAKELPMWLPSERASLLRLALDEIPQDLDLRIKLGELLKENGENERAFEVLFSQGMRYWKMGTWGDSGRMQLLTRTIPVAVSLGHCNDAREMAEGLKVFQSLQASAGKDGKELPESQIPVPDAVAVKSALAKVESCGLAQKP